VRDNLPRLFEGCRSIDAELPGILPECLEDEFDMVAVVLDDQDVDDAI